MPINFEDNIRNNNTNYTVADAMANNVRGIYWVATTLLRNGIGNSDSDVSDRRAQYVIVVVGDTPYIYTSSSIADLDWENTANWAEIGGSTSLGGLTDVDTVGVVAYNMLMRNLDNDGWTNVVPATVGGQIDLTDLADVGGSPGVDGVLQWSGSSWVTVALPDTSGIATNAAAIATNTASIGTNATNISTNVTDIATNTANIATNTGNISTNTGDISTNTGNISTNVTNITNTSTALGSVLGAVNMGTYTGAVYLTDSTTAKANILELDGAVDSNASAISTNAGAISTNAADIAGKADTTHTHALGDVTGLITSLGGLQTQIDANTAGVSGNDTDIATNAAGIAANTTSILGNIFAIDDLLAQAANNSSGISANSAALGNVLGVGNMGAYTGAVYLTDTTSAKANLLELDGALDTVATNLTSHDHDADYTPEIPGLSQTTNWGANESEREVNMLAAQMVYHDGTSYKRAPILSMWQALASNIASSNPDLFDTQLGGASNPADVDGDGVVGVNDILTVLTEFGNQGDFSQSVWFVGQQDIDASPDSHDDSTCQNPSLDLHLNASYTPDAWTLFDMDMQDSGVTDGTSTATLDRDTGSADTEWDTTSNEWVGFGSAAAANSTFQFPGKSNLAVSITTPGTDAFAVCQTTGSDTLSVKAVIRGYDSLGVQLTFSDGLPYEYTLTTEKEFVNVANNLTFPITWGSGIVPLEMNTDLDQIRVYFYGKSLQGKANYLTIKAKVRLYEV